MTDVSSIYKERLEEDIISKLAAKKGLGLCRAGQAFSLERVRDACRREAAC